MVLLYLGPKVVLFYEIIVFDPASNRVNPQPTVYVSYICFDNLNEMFLFLPILFPNDQDKVTTTPTHVSDTNACLQAVTHFFSNTVKRLRQWRMC